MLPILEKLLVVQDRDRRIAQLKAEHVRIPDAIEAIEARIVRETKHLEAARDQLKHFEADRKKLEIDAEAKRAQVLKHKTQLFQIKSNTEYQALLKEIAHLEEQIKKVEDQELELMEKVEAHQPAVKEEQEHLKEIVAKADLEKTDLKKKSGIIEKEISELEAQRADLAKDLEADAYDRYDRLMKSKGDVAIVQILNTNCGGCHLKLPPQSVHDAKRGSELVSCSYCGRILYWMDS